MSPRDPDATVRFVFPWQEAMDRRLTKRLEGDSPEQQVDDDHFVVMIHVSRKATMLIMVLVAEAIFMLLNLTFHGVG